MYRQGMKGDSIKRSVSVENGIWMNRNFVGLGMKKLLVKNSMKSIAICRNPQVPHHMQIKRQNE
ncbi:CLUMA_CG018642, isoform A [Clunio marinus]|uniref:CLUMA_CG018642, isoform A n=1 Tax=Clunio marinus TaxID=568069 RepID=A0A1J1IZM6_9DIPT|nr:CLUMA_CG018642, isoform A [Clunio marinus]